MHIFLENEFLAVGIRPMGAELFSVKHKKNELEYIWSGDPKFWGKTSPVLFPIVGTLKEDKYTYEGKSYALSRHGFARDQKFDIAAQSADEATFTLQHSPATFANYPFHFELSLGYKLIENRLEVIYTVVNVGAGDQYFSLGAHPAFSVPLVPDTDYNDYYLLFNKVENAPRWPIAATGLIERTPTPLLENTDRLALRKDMFAKDAIVLKNLWSDTVSLKHPQHDHGLDFHFNGFPYLGIWSTKNADFICIEPWCGIADGVDHDHDLTTKEGIQTLGPGKRWSRSWKVDFY
ncbi:MAG: aldose 1-epimerase family protein [Chryseolinea sp.]